MKMPTRDSTIPIPMVCVLWLLCFCSDTHTNRVVAKCQIPPNTQNIDTTTAEATITKEVPARPVQVLMFCLRVLQVLCLLLLQVLLLCPVVAAKG